MDNYELFEYMVFVMCFNSNFITSQYVMPSLILVRVLAISTIKYGLKSQLVYMALIKVICQLLIAMFANYR